MLDQERDQPTISFPLRIHRYGNWEAMNSGDDESDVFSPRLWNYNNETLSPKSRIQAIARGQREMMEMVRNMPESSYELSLKDLVEKQRVVEDGEEIEIETEEKNLINKNNIVYKREGSSGSGRKLDQMSMAKRNGDVHSGGFYLKMMIPTSLGSKKKKNNKKKKNESSGNESSKVSLRSWGSEGCLKKSPSVSTMDSESGETTCIKSGSTKSSGSSSSSSSNSSRSSSRYV